MKVRLLGLAVVLVALAVIVNALAISSASVTNAMTVSVVAPKDALLAFDTTGADDPDLSVTGTSAATGQLTITVDHGIQRNSTYIFSPAFEITNNSDEMVDIAISAPESNGVTVTGAAVTTGLPGDGTVVSSLNDVPAGKSVWVELTVLADGSATTPSINLTVTATR